MLAKANEVAAAKLFDVESQEVQDTINHAPLRLVLPIWGLFAIGLLIAIALFPSPVLAQMRAKGTYLPIFLEPEPKAVAVVRIKETFTEYQRHGFFRIGALPKLVAEGVTLELRHEDQIARALREARRGILGGKSGDYIDVREVSIRLSTNSASLLQARRLRFGEMGQWHFEDGIVFPNRTNQVHFLQGILQTGGYLAGQFAYQTGNGSGTLNLFSGGPPESNLTKVKALP